MPSRKPGRAAELRRIIEDRGYTRIGEREWEELLAAASPARAETVRRILLQTGIPLSPLVEGVRLSAFADFERSLRSLAVEYESAAAHGQSDRAAACCRIAVRAKDRARLLARSVADPARREEKEEMALWLLVFVENPAAFPAWATLRTRARLGT